MRSPANISRHLRLQVAARPDAWHRWFTARGLPLNTMRLGPQFELTSHLIQAVASGIGAGLLPGFLVEDELRSGALELAFDLPLAKGLAYYLFVPPDKLTLRPVAAFKALLLQFQETRPGG